MTGIKSPMNMPELQVYARPLVIGLIGAEVFRVAFYLGKEFEPTVQALDIWLVAILILAIVVLCIVYALYRGAHVAAKRMGRSVRFDLLIAMGIGVWTNELVSHWLAPFRQIFRDADPHWAPAILVLLCTILLTQVLQRVWRTPSKKPLPNYFITDEEIRDGKEDLLSRRVQAESFATSILESSGHPGMIFGVDGPWGVGKTSFINLAERRWEQAKDKIIVCRFEPLRYASEHDLTDRLIRELSAAIQTNIYVPEFRPAASRYSRLLKGKADISFLGFKLSLEPSRETADDLLENIDEVLKRIGRRVIIVIDDLDRLDAKTANNVFFATRQTFKLTQATYVLCYDTEVLAGREEETIKAREFLEKFVPVKLSLFIDSKDIRDFLETDWRRPENKLDSVPADTMLKLGTVLSELANILDGELAAKYDPLVGNVRKVKRFVNTMLLMQLEKNDLGRTDFNSRDLINLILLHLNFPGLFRRIYAEETEGRQGNFSVRRVYSKEVLVFQNSNDFPCLIEDQHSPSAKFLLEQLFDAETLELGPTNETTEEMLATRACFNEGNFRNLEKYLKLIVRFVTPLPQSTYILYKNAVEKVLDGNSIESILSSEEFLLKNGEYAHDQFWRILVNRSNELDKKAVDDAIETLIRYLPKYSALDTTSIGLRVRSVLSLLQLLDRAGWGNTQSERRDNSRDNISEIALRIFGEKKYNNTDIISRLGDPNRGPLGWYDLMLFRLECSADRQGQLFNLRSSLIVNQDENAQITGPVNELASKQMRKISQKVFKHFQNDYIKPKKNFYLDVDKVPDSALYGSSKSQLREFIGKIKKSDRTTLSFEDLCSAGRTLIKVFVIYQLCNSKPPEGSGVGCGYYNVYGTKDDCGIAKQMNKYIFEVCFNPEIKEENALYFIDHCLSHLSNAFFFEGDKVGYIATKTGVPGGLNPKDLGQYWKKHEGLIRRTADKHKKREVVTYNYKACYADDLEDVFLVLDELSEAAEK